MTRLTLSELSQTADSLGRVAIVLGALLYAVGLLVVTLHMAHIGYYWPDLVDRRYFLAGWWCLVPVLVWFAYGQISDRFLRSDGVQRTRPKAIVVKTLAVIGTILGSYTITYAFAYLGIRWTWLWIAMMLGSGLLVTVLPALQPKTKEATATDLSPGPFSTLLRSIDGINVSLFLGYVTLFTALLYPTVPQYLGGGAPTKVVLIPAHDALPTFLAAEIPLESAARTAPIDLLAVTSSTYIVRLDSLRVAALDRSSASGMILSAPPHTRPAKADSTSTTIQPAVHP